MNTFIRFWASDYPACGGATSDESSSSTSHRRPALIEAEWMLFETALDILRDFIEEDICGEKDETETGIRVFDRLTSEQNLILLAETASSLRDLAS